MRQHNGYLVGFQFKKDESKISDSYWIADFDISNVQVNFWNGENIIFTKFVENVHVECEIEVRQTMFKT